MKKILLIGFMLFACVACFASDSNEVVLFNALTYGVLVALGCLVIAAVNLILCAICFKISIFLGIAYIIGVFLFAYMFGHSCIWVP